MTESKKKKPEVVKTEETKFKGSQLLRMSKYNNRTARVLIKPEETYTFKEADDLISIFMSEKKG